MFIKLRTSFQVALAVYIVLLHIALAVLIFKTDFLLLAGKTLGLIPPEEWNPEIVSSILKQAAADVTLPPGRIVLIGDSMMERLEARLIGGDVTNFGIGGDTTRTLYSRLPMLRSVQNSKAVIIEIGVNDLKYRPIDAIAQDYDALFTRLPAAQTIFVLSVLPVDEKGSAARHRSYLRNDIMTALNRRIGTVCAGHSQCRFLDAWPSMLNKAVYSGDGWHLSPQGNQVLAKVIRDALP